MSKVKRIALFGMLTALAFTLSYLETLIPVSVGVPGVKLGLANLVVVTALYTLSPFEAFALSFVRVLLAALTFGNAYSVLYSLAGSLLSFFVMWAVKKSKLSIVGVSMLGGVCHNIAQIAVAAVVMSTVRIVYYLPILLVSGLVTGFLTGVLSKSVCERIKKTDRREL